MSDLREVAADVCRLPIDWGAEGNISASDLVRRSGYLAVRSHIDVPELMSCLADHPDWVRAWFRWSEDQRTVPSWGLTSRGSNAYYLTYYDPEQAAQLDPVVFDDKVRATAEYVHRMVELFADRLGT